jgi:hypothetical protein
MSEISKTTEERELAEFEEQREALFTFEPAPDEKPWPHAITSYEPKLDSRGRGGAPLAVLVDGRRLGVVLPIECGNHGCREPAWIARSDWLHVVDSLSVLTVLDAAELLDAAHPDHGTLSAWT